MTLTEQRRWLHDRQHDAERLLLDSQPRAEAKSLLANARRDLRAITALLATLDGIGATLPLFPTPPSP